MHSCVCPKHMAFQMTKLKSWVFSFSVYEMYDLMCVNSVSSRRSVCTIAWSRITQMRNFNSIFTFKTLSLLMLIPQAQCDHKIQKCTFINHMLRSISCCILFENPYERVSLFFIQEPWTTVPLPCKQTIMNVGQVKYIHWLW